MADTSIVFELVHVWAPPDSPVPSGVAQVWQAPRNNPGRCRISLERWDGQAALWCCFPSREMGKYTERSRESMGKCWLNDDFFMISDGKMTFFRSDFMRGI